MNAPIGYRLEPRPVARKESPIGGDSYLVERVIACVGEHTSKCEPTDEGWICDDKCPVEDIKNNSVFVNEIDELLDVEERIERDGWFMRKGVHWSMTRVSIRRKFKNGRSLKGDVDYMRDTWFSGKTWTQWGAKQQIGKHRMKSRQQSYG